MSLCNINGKRYKYNINGIHKNTFICITILPDHKFYFMNVLKQLLAVCSTK